MRTPGPGAEPRGVWVDDLAVIVAAWRAERPGRNRMLLVAAALAALAAAPWGIGADTLLPLALLALCLPRWRVPADAFFRTLAAVAAAAGAAILLSDEPAGLLEAPLVAGSLLFAGGILVGARRGRWWPWALAGLLLVPTRTAWQPLFPDWQAITATLALVVAARASAVEASPAAARAARDRVAVRLQARPWASAYLLVALGVASPGVLGVAYALVALAFHATWRAGTLHERVAPWAAALTVPPIVAASTWAAMQSSYPMGDIADFVLTPAWIVPLATGALAGRRAPPARHERAHTAEVLMACVVGMAATFVVSLWWERATLAGTPPGADVQRLLRWAGVGATAPFLLAWHMVATSAIPARTVLRGAALLGAVSGALTYAGSVGSDTWAFSLRSSAGDVVAWVGGAVVALLARDVARVTHVPGDHVLRTDWAGADGRTAAPAGRSAG